jgi:rubredoxin
MKIKETYFREINFSCPCPVCEEILDKFESNSYITNDPGVLEPWQVSSFSCSCPSCQSIIKYTSNNGNPYIGPQELVRESLKSVSLLTYIISRATPTEKDKAEAKQFLYGCKLARLGSWMDNYQLQVIKPTFL